MAERRPPRPAAQRPATPPTPASGAPRQAAAGQRPAAPRPTSGAPRSSHVRQQPGGRPTRDAVAARGTAPEPPRSTGVTVTAEQESLAAPWRRTGADHRARTSRSAATSAAPSGERPDGGAWDLRARLTGALHVGRRRAAPMMDAAGARVGTVTTRLQSRLRERARAQRRLSAIVWARRAGYVAAAGFLVWLVLGSPVFALDPAEVETTGYGTVVEPADVAATVAEFEGQSLATLSTSRLADALREIPGVRDASIERMWPAGLLIELTSREPVAAVPVDGGYSFVDSEATTVGRADQPPADLPVITIPVGEDHTRVLAAVLGVINQLPVELRDRVEDVSADTEDTVTFTLRDGPRVEWGSAEDSPLKAEVLQVLLDSGQADGATVIDVSAPTLPITRS